MALKNYKITKRTEYQGLFKNGIRVASKYFTMLYRVSEQAEPNKFRFGMTVSKKVGNAVKRNRYKRIIRVLMRDMCIKQEHNIDVNVITKRFIVGQNFSNIKKDFTFCLNKIFNYEKRHVKNN